MIKKHLPFIVFILIFKLSTAQELEKKYHDIVETFINCIKNNDLEKLSTKVRFPLKRDYPLPEIKDGEELIKRYKDIFDEKLTNMIIESNVKTNWSTVGWRGIMLDRGTLWLDHEGNLIAVNYESNNEKIIREQLIEEDRKSIHSSLKDFESPILILETKKFRIRIDQLSNNFYRYASWNINSPMHEKPKLILENGKWIPDGSGGNHRY